MTQIYWAGPIKHTNYSYKIILHDYTNSRLIDSLVTNLLVDIRLTNRLLIIKSQMMACCHAEWSPDLAIFLRQQANGNQALWLCGLASLIQEHMGEMANTEEAN